MTDVEIINQQITSFGKNLREEPLYRIVWSDYQTELRYGRFREFFGKIFLREIVGTKEVPKYNFISERWILERWFPPEQVYNPEIPMSAQGSYEPIYVFQDKFGGYLHPNQRVTEIIIGRAEHPIRKTPEERKTEEEEREEKEIQYYMDYLEVSPITNALHMKEAVGFDPRNLMQPSPEAQEFYKKVEKIKEEVN